MAAAPLAIIGYIALEKAVLFTGSALLGVGTLIAADKELDVVLQDEYQDSSNPKPSESGGGLSDEQKQAVEDAIDRALPGRSKPEDWKEGTHDTYGDPIADEIDRELRNREKRSRGPGRVLDLLGDLLDAIKNSGDAIGQSGM